MEIDELLDLAFDAVGEGRLEDAEDLCRRILGREPRNFDAMMLSGVLAGERGKPELGIEFLRSAVAIQPESAEAYLQLGGLLKAEGRLPEAISAFEQAVRLEPGNLAAHNNLGVILLEANRAPEAIACLKRTIELSANQADAHYRLGTVFEVQELDSDAIAAYRQAVKIDPNHADAHERLANLLYIKGAIPDAMKHFRRAADADPEASAGRRSQARVFFEEGRLAEAEDCLRQAIGRDAKSGELHRLLGNTLNQLGRFDEAIRCFETATETEARHVLSFHDLVHAKKLTENDRPLIARMEALLAEGGLNDQKRISLHFGLGKAYDDLGGYEKAIWHFDEANRLKTRACSFDRARLSRFVDQSIAVFTKAFLSRGAEGASVSELPVLVLGMPRSGTTLVEQIVSSHPKVAAGGELAFWSNSTVSFDRSAAGRLDPRIVGKLAGDYLTLLRGISPRSGRVTDKMPDNFLWIGLIHAVFPWARIIHCRRQPVDIALSIYFTHFNQSIDFAYDRSDIVFYYQQYARLMAHWRHVLPPERFLEVDYENLVVDRDQVTRQLIAFCGLEWDDACLKHENNRRAVRTASLWQARQPVYTTSVERWRRYEPWLGELRRLLPDAI